MVHSYRDRVAIVTGGARGIGAATCRLLVECGALVVIADPLEEEGRTLAGELGERAVFYKMDVSVQTDWDAVVRTATDFGALAILGNNAGILLQATVLDTTEEQFTSCFRVNQLGVFLGMRAVFPALKQAGDLHPYACLRSPHRGGGRIILCRLRLAPGWNAREDCAHDRLPGK